MRRHHQQRLRCDWSWACGQRLGGLLRTGVNGNIGAGGGEYLQAAESRQDVGRGLIVLMLMRSLSYVLLDEGFLEARVGDLLQCLLDRVPIVQQKETNSCGQFAEGIGEVCELLALLFHESKLDALGDDECGLVEVPGLETDSEGGVVLVVLCLNVYVLIEQIEDGEEVVLFAGIMKEGTLEDVHQVEVDIPVADQHLQHLHLLKWLTRLPRPLHLAETVEDRRTLVLVQRVDLGPVLDQQSAYLRIGVHVGGVESQMVKGVALVHVQEIRVDAEGKKVLDLLHAEVLASLDQLNEGYFVPSCAEVYFALVLPQDGHELVLTVKGSVEDGEGLVTVKAVGVKAHREQILEDALGVIVLGNGV